MGLLSSFCVNPSNKIYIAASAALTAASEVQRCSKISFRIKPGGPTTPAQLDTDHLFCDLISHHAQLPLVHALLGSHQASDSLQTVLYGLGTG